MFLLYEALLYVVSIIVAPWFLLIGFLRGKYLPNLRERLGIYRTDPEPHDLWMHAVSVGEVMAARSILVKLLEIRPETSVVITTTTITGQATARRLFPGSTITYFPFDFSFSVGRFLDRHQPRVYATMETEIWPNVTRLASRRGMRLILANARLSDRSFPRYRAVTLLVRQVLRRYDAILARDSVDCERFIAVGARPEVTSVSGNVKFDFDGDQTPVDFDDAFVALVRHRPVVIAGSTVDGEDELLLPQLAALVADGFFVVVAPRKPERFELVAAIIETAGIRMIRRSEIAHFSGETDLLLLDSIGELSRLYRHAMLAFVGGSLVPSGGHNPIEPAAAGAPVAFGPHMANFREIASTFLRNGGAVEIATPEELGELARTLRREPDQRSELGRRGLETVTRNRGAAALTAARIAEMLQ